MLIFGLLILIFGAEVLVRSGTHLASRLGISPITIVLAVVAIGTSMPVTSEIRIDLGLIAVVSLVCIPVFITSKKVNRIEGAFFVLAYCAYLTWLLSTRI